MTEKVYALDTKPGIQRDGTVADKQFYNDGQWVRFQRGRPRKMLGYRNISNGLKGPSRGIWVNPQNGFNYIFSGYSGGLQQLTVDNNGVGSGVVDFTLSNFTASVLNLWQFDGIYDVAGGGVASLVAHPGQNLAQIDSTANTPVLIGQIGGTTMSQIGVFQNTDCYLNLTKYVTVAGSDPKIGAGQTVTGTSIAVGATVVSTAYVAPNLPGVAVTGVGGTCTCTSPQSGLYIGQTVTVSGTLTGTATGISSGTTYYIIATDYFGSFTLSATSGGSAITTTAGTTDGLLFTLGFYTKVELSAVTSGTGPRTLTFNNEVSVSGGVISLHPYVFVFGDNGLIKNCSAGDPQDWVSTDANETNVATGKIVQGLPVRGGSNSPSGLFWSLDSVIRVSYSPQTLTVGGVAVTKYWRYDIISSQSSMLSSQCAIEYDGVYYWVGVDRFLLYNGVVKEIPNSMNQNWFFDNLNYAQRQKVWVSKVPRYGEIWWYYPRGNSTECNDAIVYNVREQTWYDAGQALGARRSAGYFSQVLAYPILANWETSTSVEVTSGTYNVVNGTVYLNGDTYNTSVVIGLVATGGGIPTGTLVTAVAADSIKASSISAAGSGYVPGTYTNVPLTGGLGGGAKATIVVNGFGVVSSVTLTNNGGAYAIGDSLTASNSYLGGSGSGFAYGVTDIYAQKITLSAAVVTTAIETVTFYTQADLVSICQHEFGVNAVNGQSVDAIESYFETNDLGWIAGGPSQPAMEGANFWLRLERVEPDFVLNGTMSLIVTGRPFAQSADTPSDPYVFDANTGKIDMKEQRRELRLKFISNEINGDYQLGRVMLNGDFGDVRGYGA